MGMIRKRYRLRNTEKERTIINLLPSQPDLGQICSWTVLKWFPLEGFNAKKNLCQDLKKVVTAQELNRITVSGGRARQRSDLITP